MPAAPRVPGKATNIAYKILGIPDNIKYKPKGKDAENNRRLNYEDTRRER